MSGFFIGIDVGGTNLKAGLTDETGRLLAAARRPLDFRGAETFAADLADLAAEVLSTAGYADVAKSYILYRKQREKVRNANATLLDYKDLVLSLIHI